MESHIVAKRAATGFATLCFGKPRQQQERQEELQPRRTEEDADDADIKPVPAAAAAERKREIATHDQANQTDDITDLSPQPSSMESSTVAVRPPPPPLPPLPPLPSLPPLPPPPSDLMLSKVRHAQWSWSWAVKSVKLNQRFVQALLAAHYEFPEMMDKRLLLSHIQSLGRVLRAYAMQQPEFVGLEETVQEDLLRRNTPIFVQVPFFRVRPFSRQVTR